MGLGSLWCTEQLRLGLDVDEDDVEEDEEAEDELEVETGEEERVTWEVEEDVMELVGGLTPTNPLTRLNRGSAHRLLLQLAGSRVKRPV